jgi:hypothetical protein
VFVRLSILQVDFSLGADRIRGRWVAHTQA